MPIRLSKPRTEPEWIDLGYGAAVQVLPPSTTIVFAARARANEMAAQLIEAGEVITKAGARIEGPLDFSSPAALAEASQSLFVVALAEMAVIDWRGMLAEVDEGQPEAPAVPLAFDAGHLAQLLSDPDIAETFLRKYYRPVHEVVREGNV